MNVGEYVRNKYGISKLIYKEDYKGIDVYHFDRDICFLINKETGEEKYRCSSFANTKDIDINKIKHSKNIIDLIEIGDYVNGMKVFEVMKNPETDDIKEHLIVFVNEIKNELYTIYGNEIKSIVTKEQFESMEYKL